MRRHAWIAVWWTLWCTRALAQDSLPLDLSWRAPAACPGADAVGAELARMARVRPGFELEPLSATVEVARAPGAYQAEVHTRRGGQAGSRTLEARDCTTLVQTVALVLALSFGEGVEVKSGAPRAAEPGEAAQPPRQDETTAEATPLERASSQSGAAPEHFAPVRRPFAWRYLLGAGAQFGLLGSAMATVSGQLELERAALQLALRATASFAPERAVAPDIDARFSAASAALSACGTLGLGPLTGALCGAGHVGLLHGRSSGAAEGASDAPWGALSAQLALTWPRTFWLRVRLQGGLLISLYRARFVIDGIGTVERVERLVPELVLLLVFAPS